MGENTCMLLTGTEGVEGSTEDSAADEETTCTEDVNVAWTDIKKDVVESSAVVVGVITRWTVEVAKIDCCMDADIEVGLLKVVGVESSCDVLAWVVAKEDANCLVSKLDAEENPEKTKLELVTNEVESNRLV